MQASFSSIREILDFIAGQNEMVFGASIWDGGIHINRRGAWDFCEWAPEVTAQGWKKEYAEMVGLGNIADLPKTQPIDRGLELPSVDSAKPVRFRSSYTHGRGGWELVVRQLPPRILPDSMIRLPRALVENYIELNEGLVLICGATGSGKSATMTFLNDQRLRERSQKLITVENPIEYVYDDYFESFVRQREVGQDTESFLNAIRESMRQDPDMIMVQEIRTPQEAVAAMDAGLTGHVVIASIHAFNTVTAIQRYKSLLEMASGGTADMLALGAAIKIVIAQQLHCENQTVAPIHEIMVAIGGGISQAICNSDFNGLSTSIETGNKLGMITFERSKEQLLNNQMYAVG